MITETCICERRRIHRDLLTLRVNEKRKGGREKEKRKGRKAREERKDRGLMACGTRRNRSKETYKRDLYFWNECSISPLQGTLSESNWREESEKSNDAQAMTHRETRQRKRREKGCQGHAAKERR